MSLVGRVGRALVLDRDLFEEVEHDRRALGQALAVVVAAGVARGLGVLPEEGAIGIAAGVVGGLIFWIAAAGAVDLIGVHVLHGRSSFFELLRTFGFAAAPLLLLVLEALPWRPVKLGVWIAAHALATVALSIAVRQSLDTTPTRALLALAAALATALLLLLTTSYLLFSWL